MRSRVREPVASSHGTEGHTHDAGAAAAAAAAPAAAAAATLRCRQNPLPCSRAPPKAPILSVHTVSSSVSPPPLCPAPNGLAVAPSVRRAGGRGGRRATGANPPLDPVALLKRDEGG